ncbi:hypothetical protein AALA24_13665 [Anaerovoracaceae bacterium 42-11]
MCTNGDSSNENFKFEKVGASYMRNIRVSFPSGTIKMVLWEGTEMV